MKPLIARLGLLLLGITLCQYAPLEGTLQPPQVMAQSLRRQAIIQGVNVTKKASKTIGAEIDAEDTSASNIMQWVGKAWNLGAGFVGILAVLALVVAGIFRIIGYTSMSNLIITAIVPVVVVYFVFGAFFYAVAPLFYDYRSEVQDAVDGGG
ncbi:hypothetical protein H6771_00085 [Candidatus Peribacteria bacterium]|nr:hypothetical protein [Candidatus Peribacteria bacterium]